MSVRVLVALARRVSNLCGGSKQSILWFFWVVGAAHISLRKKAAPKKPPFALSFGGDAEGYAYQAPQALPDSAEPFGSTTHEPASTGSTAPVIMAESSLAKNTTAPVI